MKKRRDTIQWQFILMAVTILPVEIAIFFGLVFHYLNVAAFLILYAMVAGAVSIYVYLYSKFNKDLRYPLLLLLSVIGTGPFGVAGFLLLSILHPLFSLFATPAHVWLEELFPEQNQSAFLRIFHRVKSGWDDYGSLNEVSSFQDIFSFGSLSQRHAVLDAVVKDFQPVYSPVLLRALNDEHNTVRIQAAAIMAKLDLTFDDELKRLLVKHHEFPHDTKAVLKVAEHYDFFASLGVHDKQREKELGERAIHFYHLYLKSQPEDKNVWFTLGKLYFHIEDLKGFMEWYGEYKAKFVHVPAIIETWRTEMAYKLSLKEALADA